MSWWILFFVLKIHTLLFTELNIPTVFNSKVAYRVTLNGIKICLNESEIYIEVIEFG